MKKKIVAEFKRWDGKIEKNYFRYDKHYERAIQRKIRND